MEGAGILFLGFRFHPGHFDVLRLFLLQFRLELHQLDVIPQGRLYVLASQLLFHVLQQLLYYRGLSLFFLLSLSLLTTEVYPHTSGAHPPHYAKLRSGKAFYFL
jgi:hypothetical protein